MMNTITKSIFAAGLLVILSGCEDLGLGRSEPRPVEPVTYYDEPRSEPETRSDPKKTSYLTRETVERDEAMPGEGAVSKAMYWADKYAEQSKELQIAHQRISELEKELRDMNARLASREATLAATQNELADANLMLEEMKRDLDEWRNNVLGFREEIVQAQAAQLKAMQQILEYLGADVPK